MSFQCCLSGNSHLLSWLPILELPFSTVSEEGGSGVLLVVDHLCFQIHVEFCLSLFYHMMWLFFCLYLVSPKAAPSQDRCGWQKFIEGIIRGKTEERILPRTINNLKMADRLDCFSKFCPSHPRNCSPAIVFFRLHTHQGSGPSLHFPLTLHLCLLFKTFFPSPIHKGNIKYLLFYYARDFCFCLILFKFCPHWSLPVSN